jgi:hypothetical protein
MINEYKNNDGLVTGQKKIYETRKKNLLQCHWLHHESCMNSPGIEPKEPQWEYSVLNAWEAALSRSWTIFKSLRFYVKFWFAVISSSLHSISSSSHLLSYGDHIFCPRFTFASPIDFCPPPPPPWLRVVLFRTSNLLRHSAYRLTYTRPLPHRFFTYFHSDTGLRLKKKDSA